MTKDFSLTQIIAILSGFAITGIVVGFVMIQITRQDEPSIPEPIEEDDVPALTVSLSQMPSYRDFAFDLFLDIARTNPGNFGFSPYGVYSALSAIAQGSESETKEQLLQTLNTAILEEDVVRETNLLFKNHLLQDDVFTASSFLVKTGAIVNENYQLKAKDYFLMRAGNIPPLGRDINDWFSENTNENITQVINHGPVSPLITAYLINAFAVDVSLEEVLFFKENTVESFYTKEGAVSTSFGIFTGTASYFSGENAELVSISVRDKNYTTHIIVPRDELSSFYQTFSLTQFQEKKNQARSKNITIKIPTVVFSSSLQLEENLRAINVINIFSPTLADFSKMIDVYEEDPVYINTFMQEVAVAVTFGEHKSSTTDSQEEYLVDISRPFIVIIEEKNTNNIIFMGHIARPVTQ